MNIAHWALRLLLLWTVLGAAGTLLALFRHETARARRGAVALASVWAVYLVVLVAVSHAQPLRTVMPGSERCFDDLCFAVVGAEDLEGFYARGRDPERLVRVSIRIRNRGKSHRASASGLRATLIDAAGRRWIELPGLSGVPLAANVLPGAVIISRPVFRVDTASTGFALLLFHVGFSSDRLVIGDPESLGHRPMLLQLPSAVSATTTAVRSPGERE